MKFLTQYQKFLWDEFMTGKQLMVVGVGENVDFETKKVLGSKIEVVIVRDDTVYQQKKGEQKSNRFEKFNIKLNKKVDVNVNSYVYPVDVVAKVYGQYNDQLSVTAGDIKVVQANKA